MDDSGAPAASPGPAADAPSSQPSQPENGAGEPDLAGLPAVLPSTRVDRWLWAVRLTKTRGEAAQACRGGHVEVNDRPAKPATPVRAGDMVTAHVHGRRRIVEVGQVIDKRVGAALAQHCYTDNTPPPPPGPRDAGIPRRDRGAGRPTKRDRRRMDHVRRGHR